MLRRRPLAAAIFLALVWSPLVLIQAFDEAPDKPASGDKPAGDPSATPRKDEPLSASQELISRRYKRFEDTLYKIAESMRKTDPDRADLLVRAIGKSKEDRIGAQMADLVALLKDNKQLGDAVERQGDVVTQLHALLDLLLSEDRAQELREEKKRIERYLKELNQIIAKEKGNRADNERGAPADEVAGAQKKIADQTENLKKGIDKDDAAKQANARSKSGKPSNSGKSGAKDGKDSDERDSDGKPGDAKDGDKRDGDAKDGDKKDGDSKDGEPKPGDAKDADGKGSDKSDDSKDGQPGKGEPKDGQPSDGQNQKGQPGEGQPSEGQPGEGQPGEQGDSAPPQPTPGREELEKAKRNMQQAIENLKKNRRHEASDEQDEALANLQKAKEKLEEILRQLREEERDRFLAMLEARFQRMLAMQLMVYDGTVKLAKVAEDDRSGRHASKSQQLSRQEEEIAIEATKAITLLREEGTAVAFPEAVEQMRDDMRIVVARLERTDVGELTQGIEREIIDALEEMIEALQKEMEKSKDKDKQQPPPKDSQPQDPPLIDQLAELKMLRTLQLRVNNRTKRLGRLVDGEQAENADIVNQLQNLADRQARIQKATYDMVTGRNK